MERQDELKQQRDKIQALAQQAKDDPKFKESLRRDPVGVLKQAGVVDDAIGDFLREEGYTKADPATHNLSTEGKSSYQGLKTNLRCWDECCFTCMCTDCCITKL
jgi:hypothetical protein